MSPPKRESALKGWMPVFIAAVGVVAIGYMLDWHGHRCESCGHTWRHLGAFNLGDPVAHTCSKCATVQWWKDGVPHVFRDSLRTPPPDPYAKMRQQLAMVTQSQQLGETFR